MPIWPTFPYTFGYYGEGERIGGPDRMLLVLPVFRLCFSQRDRKATRVFEALTYKKYSQRNPLLIARSKGMLRINLVSELSG